jgi:hypothetical protein
MQDQIFKDLPCTFVYLDDQRVASRDMKQHVGDLRAMFQVLADNGLAINLDKCKFAVPALDFLGHRLSAASVTPLSGSLQVMYDFLWPHTIKDLQRFLGMVNFYRRFLPKIAQILAPLTNLLKGKDLPKELPWEQQHETTFMAAKAALAVVVTLAHLRSDLALAADTSNTYIGGVLQQQVGGHWQVEVEGPRGNCLMKKK